MFFPVAFGLGWMEMSVILVIALLLFGKRLPEVMRSAGKGIVEFKRGMKDIEDEVSATDHQISSPKGAELEKSEKETTN